MNKTRKMKPRMKPRKSVKGGSIRGIEGILGQPKINSLKQGLLSLSLEKNVRRFFIEFNRDLNQDDQMNREFKDVYVNIARQALAERLKLGSHQSPIYKLFEHYFTMDGTKEDQPISTYMELTPAQKRDLGKASQDDTEKPEAIKVQSYYDALSEFRKIAHKFQHEGSKKMRLIWIPSTKKVPVKYLLRRKDYEYTEKDVRRLNKSFADEVLGEGEGEAFMGKYVPSLRSRLSKTFGSLNRTRRSLFSRSSHVSNPLAAESFDNGSNSNDDPVGYPTNYTRKVRNQ